MAEQLLRAPGQPQVQRLRRGDEDVRRVAQHLRTLTLRWVAGAHPHLQLGSDPAQGRAEVAVNVVGEGLERGDVDEADARFGASAVSRAGAHRAAIAAWAAI